MKKISKILLFAFIVAGVASCETDDNLMFVEQPAEFSILTPDNGTSIELVEATPQTNPAVTFTWEDVDYGTPTAVTYDLQFAKNGTDFAEPLTITSSTATAYTITVGDLNDIASDYFVDGDPETDDTGTIDVRIKATVGTTDSEPKYSNVVSIVVTPFVPVPTISPKLYIVGSFQAASGYGNDWTPGDGVPLEAASPTSTNYEGYAYFANGDAQYKFLPTNTGWDGDYGDAGDTAGVYTGVIESDGEVNAGLPGGEAGYYFVKVDTGENTYSLAKQNWGIIGTATPGGWDSDTDLTYDPASKKWKVVMNLNAGDFKFRANDGWDVNFGDTGADGVLDAGGDNIVTTGGSYIVELDLSVPRHYTYTLTPN